ncbi:hypothetical protein [Mesorhizobium sp. L-8-10]|uniref:hypothetical protein n=1 Tax=Mesorhizobium sp. L-8-10 TaxID=2744523 RepID=UPI00192645E7|nr:hypothetical protein [Mesorhizobium sp. L-8-10]
MRSVFGFKTRSAERDQQTDAARFQRIRDVIAEVSGEMDREKSGFEKRYGTVAADAAFLVEAMDNEASPSGDSERIATLTETLRACERRIAFLNRQMLFMEECRQFVQQFVDANGIDAGGSAKAE